MALAPKIDPVDGRSEHQGVMMLMIMGRVAEHPHAGRRKELFDIRLMFGATTMLAVSQHLAALAVENGGAGLCRHDPESLACVSAKVHWPLPVAVAATMTTANKNFGIRASILWTPLMAQGNGDQTDCRSALAIITALDSN